MYKISLVLSLMRIRMSMGQPVWAMCVGVEFINALLVESGTLHAGVLMGPGTRMPAMCIQILSRAAAHETMSAVEGHAKSMRLEPAVLRVTTLVYFFEGVVAVAGIVTEPKTCTNWTGTEKEEA